MDGREVVLVDGTRTGFGRMGGTLKDCLPSDLAATAVKGLLAKTRIQERGKVDCLFCGSAFGDVHTLDLARYIALAAGLPYETSATFLEMQCGSAIDGINHAAWKILDGAADVIIAGGTESHSQAFAKFSTTQPPCRGLPPQAVSQVLTPIQADDLSMLEISDGMAKRWGITREDCDHFALRSQKRASEATSKGLFKEEIVPVVLKGGKKDPDLIFDQDEHIRPNTSIEGLRALKPVLGPDGVTTAGNASGRNDGAAFVLMMTAEKAKEYGYTPFARWICGADCGVDPKVMGIGPAYSNLLALKRAGLKPEDVSVYECNEAFAAQNLSVIREMEALSGARIPLSNWNPNGGAIAFGHPNGASGARICIFTMRELVRRSGRYGLFSSCCGGGYGVSTLIENLQN